MPDIRTILNALDEQDSKLYSKLRSDLRKSYLKALSAIVGVEHHNEDDDGFLDWIDIKVATLFDRAGRFDHSQGEIDKTKAIDIEQHIQAEVDKIKPWSNGENK